ncbi:hypothetical protein, partial [uncultured Dialister sp.]|uniref:hypothetical protein n=1 Tax=uncultured Dialister sp. TaxID=278064 RepID=UPI0027DBB6FA
ASHARLSTGCLLGFAGSGLSPDYTIHAELAHNLRTLRTLGAKDLPAFPSEPVDSGTHSPLYSLSLLFIRYDTIMIK